MDLVDIIRWLLSFEYDRKCKNIPPHLRRPFDEWVISNFAGRPTKK